VVDWFSRGVLAWRVSITMAVAFCLEAVAEALAKHGTPEIFNTGQGSRFTSAAFTGARSDNAIAISMDGKGSWRDKVFVERLWRSVKYEEVYLRAYDSVSEAHLDRPISGLLQSTTAAFPPCRSDAGSRTISDLNGDGNTDILWRNTNGQVSAWLMNGTMPISEKIVGSAPSSWSTAMPGRDAGDPRLLWPRRLPSGDLPAKLKTVRPSRRPLRSLLRLRTNFLCQEKSPSC